MAAVSVVPAAVQRLVSRLRFPQLFLLAATLFVLDLLIPDLIPFADEILLGLLTVLLGSLERRTGTPGPPGEVREVKDITPSGSGSPGR